MAALLVALIVTGCTGVVDGVSGTPETGAPTSAEQATSRYQVVLAPPVDDPRDVRGIAACNLLTTEQEQRLGMDLASEEQIRAGEDRGCRWRTVDGAGVLDVVGVQDPPVGLDGLYRVRDGYPVFEPGEIADRPIVRADLVDTGGRDCRVFVGVADDQMIQASASYPFVADMSCEVAREMAEAMIENLPPAR